MINYKVLIKLNNGREKELTLKFFEERNEDITQQFTKEIHVKHYASFKEILSWVHLGEI